LPVFRSNNIALELAQGAKAFLSGKRGERQKLKRKKRELSRIKEEISAANERTEFVEYRRRRKRLEQEIFQLERELRASREGRAVGELEVGALPDFLIIGAMKSGTTFLYNLLTLHPHVEPAATKELHYFDNLIDEEDTEWYRRCFPTPRWKDGRMTITGEATPSYLSHPRAPEKIAEVIPQARLIVLLRNPVDRAYSDFQQSARKGEARKFGEAIEVQKAWLRRRRRKTSEREDHAGLDDSSKYLTRGIYVDQLLRWSEFFSEEQMLVLKSEDLFEHPQDTLKLVLDFLDLPEWGPEAWEKIPKKRNQGKSYEQKMDRATRQRLEGFFEPHNRRLYDYLGVDFGW
jgi:hypothetical protein